MKKKTFIKQSNMNNSYLEDQKNFDKLSKTAMFNPENSLTRY